MSTGGRSLVSGIARQLEQCGLARGDVVAALGGNSPEVWALLRATEELGLVLALFNRSWSPAHLYRLSEKLRPRLVIGYGPGGNEADDFVDGWLDAHGRRLELWTPLIRDCSAPSGLDGSVEGALIFCTSGSAGDSKCVASSLGNRSFSTLAIGRYLGLSPGQCIVNALSPSFDYGFYQGLLAREFGLETQIVASLQMTGDILARIRKGKRIVFPLTPALAARIVRALPLDTVFPQVEIVTLTGGAISLGLRQRLTEVFPQARIFAMYGLTECKRVAYLEPEEFLDHPESCGREMPGVEGAILDPSGRPVEPGIAGELVIKGANVCLGYWGDPEATALRFRRDATGEVVLFTGDLFRRDTAGRLEFVCRNDELVKLRDERVSLGAIENELRRSKLVLDVALEVVTDSLEIPLLRARVVPRDPLVTESELLGSFRKLASRAGHVPHEVIIASGFALNAHGKHARASRSNYSEGLTAAS